MELRTLGQTRTSEERDPDLIEQFWALNIDLETILAVTGWSDDEFREVLAYKTQPNDTCLELGDFFCHFVKDVFGSDYGRPLTSHPQRTLLPLSRQRAGRNFKRFDKHRICDMVEQTRLRKGQYCCESNLNHGCIGHFVRRYSKKILRGQSNRHVAYPPWLNPQEGTSTSIWLILAFLFNQLKPEKFPDADFLGNAGLPWSAAPTAGTDRRPTRLSRSLPQFLKTRNLAGVLYPRPTSSCYAVEKHTYPARTNTTRRRAFMKHPCMRILFFVVLLGLVAAAVPIFSHSRDKGSDAVASNSS